ncbi:Mitochondrial GTPase 1 [Dispira parvispora]|uniref:Mitochondrial GTPase 1 n=1 Tax=Dispira parvispora TaxID=1520584 RepID=A0A9W8E543_9FUNG|nr:Mitochondrial GTPase 1 [Dispira parvispora]
MALPSFRSAFHLDRAFNWFPGHMARGLREIQTQLQKTDVVVEVRDARIPLSSINPQLEQLANHKDHVVVYNKADLADPASRPSIIQNIRRFTGQQQVLFTSTHIDRDVRRIIEYAAARARTDPLRYPSVTVTVIGMPNVGKSSLINAMRRIGVGKGKAAPTGANPGVTRRVAGVIRVLEDPPVYLVDSPGVMVPYIADPIRSFKVALTGGMKEDVTDVEVLADYLLYQLNQKRNRTYCDMFHLTEPSDDIAQVLPAIARRIGALKKGGGHHLDWAARHFIKQFQLGKFGRYTLDDMTQDNVEMFFRTYQRPVRSRTRQRKEERAERIQARRAKQLAKGTHKQSYQR